MQHTGRSNGARNNGPIDSSSIFNDNPLLLGSAALVATVGMSGYYSVGPPVQDMLPYSGYILSALVSMVLGFRTDQARHSVPSLKTSLNVAWQIGVMYIVLQAFSEHLITGTARFTVLQFPLTLYLYVCVSLIAFNSGSLLSIGFKILRNIPLRELFLWIVTIERLISSLSSMHCEMATGHDTGKSGEQVENDRLDALSDKVDYLMKKIGQDPRDDSQSGSGQ